LTRVQIPSLPSIFGPSTSISRSPSPLGMLKPLLRTR
jgi:hypothetical protein